jgi:predicted RecB family nuclease
MPVTAALLYDLVHCPHRVTMDLFTEASRRDPVNPFVQLLWERGNLYEKSVVADLETPFLDLSSYSGTEKERLTQQAMARGERLIYGGRIEVGDLLGDPDLLRLEDRGYVPGDIKSGVGEEGDGEDSRPKKHYAVQLALYVDVLERKGLSAGRRGFIWDVHGKEVVYDFMAAQGTRNTNTLWDVYQEALGDARRIIGRSGQTLPAYGAVCKLCHWYSACLGDLAAVNDLTLIPELGRSKRDVLVTHVRNIRELAGIDVSALTRGKKTIFPGIGPETLAKLVERAQLLVSPDPKPYLKNPIALPQSDVEIFFDIEVDPMRDLCYLHGFIERRGGDNSSEYYIACFAETPTLEAEEAVFASAWKYLCGTGQAAVYYYSKYERTIWRKLQEKYPHVCAESDLEEFFHKAIDLYFDVVRPHTEWPTRDFSIKSLAKYLGFTWRDTNPSGAASIEWYHRWVESGDPLIKQRILDYNEDDCRATRVLLDEIRKLPVYSVRKPSAR